MSNDTDPTLDPDALKLAAFKVWSYKMGEQVALMIHLGDRLGLYRAMWGQGPLSSDAVAARAQLNERFVREWLYGQAAAGLVVHDNASFELTDEFAAILADEERSLAFAVGAFRGGVEPTVLDRIADSFRTGIGVTYEELGPAAAAGLARMTGPWSRLALTSTILPAMEGLVDKLDGGAKVVDVGCGGGVTLTTIAAAFPSCDCVGYDPSQNAVDLATARAREMGLTNTRWVTAGGEDLETGAGYDLVLTFDCLHDMPRPDVTARAVRRAIADDGTWVIKDIRSSGDFERDTRNPMLAMMYGFSIMSCLQSAMSTPDGAGLGTLGLHPEAAEELTREAGFTRFDVHDFDDPANLYYEVRV